MRGELQLISPDLEPVGGHDMLVVAVWGSIKDDETCGYLK
jgi:hypothetical protein